MKHLCLPLTTAVRASLRAGEEVTLSGPCYTMRDATFARLLALVREEGDIPDYLRDQLLFFAGPTPARAGRPFGSIGPTTATRMDRAHSELMAYGLTASLGKGDRSELYRQAAIEHGAVYFSTVGGAAAVLALHVTAAEVVKWPELGPEALTRLELENFPALVAIDPTGADLYQQRAKNH